MSDRIACVWFERLPDGRYRGGDGAEYFSDQLPVGAVYDLGRPALDRGTGLNRAYSDGLTICVRTPGGPWVVDGPAYDGNHYKPCPWTRTGDPRQPHTLSVTPSINIKGEYHGWLRDGHLVPA